MKIENCSKCSWKETVTLKIDHDSEVTKNAASHANEMFLLFFFFYEMCILGGSIVNGKLLNVAITCGTLQYIF